ncbi:hypothetical protein AMJ57_03925 [Parcubacteria bacterium SG8_24]|nr:MAG: hypothetical protein AMJ57_03925 [Parcubacteria bacterium SG8_24]
MIQRYHRRNGSRGATLLELLVYLGLVGFILLAATMFAFEFVAANAKIAAIDEVTRNGRFGLARMALETRVAASIDTVSSVFGSHPGTLALDMDDAGIDPTVFTVSSGTLYVQQGAGAQLPLTSSKVEVTDFVVENVSTGNKTKAVRLNLTLRYRSGGLQDLVAESTFEVTARVRKGDGFLN